MSAVDAANSTNDTLWETAFPTSRSLVGRNGWRRLVELFGDGCGRKETFVEELEANNAASFFPDYLPAVARVEMLKDLVAGRDDVLPTQVGSFVLNPTLEVVENKWRVAESLNPEPGSQPDIPEPGREQTLIWLDPNIDSARVKAASQEDLFVIKTLAEGWSIEQVAEAGGILSQKVYQTLHRATSNGLVLGPPTNIRRPVSFASHPAPQGFAHSPAFVVQWHITHACDLHCKHCYDRSKRSPLTLDQGIEFLDDLGVFCREKNVRGHVCFSGGNPFLHPDFADLYQGTADRGFATSILGNPVSREQIRQIRDIQPPLFYQVSVEGLPEHNDSIRGDGTFTDVIEFLGVLRDLGIPSTVMLTLTKDNVDQVIPLGKRLSGHADHFTFNRLAAVGEGADLLLPDSETYRRFLGEYLEAAASNPEFTLKDNLLNLAKYEEGDPMFDGCTGYGCGAAFNFAAVLPDGDVHACRKFPSPIGNIFETNLQTVYDSDTASRYRQGTDACRACALKYRCGGCMAVVNAAGGRIFEDRDPMCFIGDEEMQEASK